MARVSSSITMCHLMLPRTYSWQYLDVQQCYIFSSCFNCGRSISSFSWSLASVSCVTPFVLSSPLTEYHSGVCRLLRASLESQRSHELWRLLSTRNSYPCCTDTVCSNDIHDTRTNRQSVRCQTSCSDQSQLAHEDLCAERLDLLLYLYGGSRFASHYRFKDAKVRGQDLPGWLDNSSVCRNLVFHC